MFSCLKCSLLGIFFFFMFTLPVFSQRVKEKEETYIFRKGQHHATRLMKNRYFKQVELFHWQTLLDSSARYQLRNADGTIDVDQYDWSKLSGVTFSPLRTLRNTAMVGWRYNISKDSIELIPYFHVDGQRLFTDDPHLTIGINEPFEHEIHLNYSQKEITVLIKTKHGTMSQTHRFKQFRNWVVQIHPYFGGNKSAPRHIKVKVRLKTRKRLKSAR